MWLHVFLIYDFKFHGFFIIYFQGTYLHHKEIKAAQGIKITAQVTMFHWKVIDLEIDVCCLVARMKAVLLC